MLTERPAWTCTAQRHLTQWYGHVMCLPEHALGQWICIRRSDGKVLWERKIHRANTIAGVQDHVIVASERRSDGPWTSEFGCYGFDLETGEPLWVSHRNGMFGKLLCVFDYLPGFTNDLRDKPYAIRPGEVICRSGRVLDIRTGRFLRKLSRDDIPPQPKRQDPAWRLYETALHSPPGPPVDVGHGCFLSTRPPAGYPGTESPELRGQDLLLYGTDASGTVKWLFRASETGYHIRTNFYSYRLAPPFLYCVMSDAPTYVPIDPGKPRYGRFNPASWHLLTIDVRNGKQVQDIPLGRCQEQPARIEDIDEQGVLVSMDNQRVSYFRRAE